MSRNQTHFMKSRRIKRTVSDLERVFNVSVRAGSFLLFARLQSAPNREAAMTEVSRLLRRARLSARLASADQMLIARPQPLTRSRPRRRNR